MTSSATNSILSEKKNLDRLSHATRAYFQNRTKNRVHNLVLTKFRQEKEAGRLTQALLAKRMGKTPDQISRILNYPSNLGLEMLSDLLLAIVGEEIDATSSDPEKRAPANARSKEILADQGRPILDLKVYGEQPVAKGGVNIRYGEFKPQPEPVDA